MQLEVKITDSADHTETVTKTIPVADQPIRVSLIPEGERLVPGIANYIFAAAVYPDGSPVCQVRGGDPVEGQPGHQGETRHNHENSTTADSPSSAWTPKPEEFHQEQWVERKIEMLGGSRPASLGSAKPV